MKTIKRKLLICSVVLAMALSVFSASAFAAEKQVYISGQSIGIAILSDGLIVTKAVEVKDKDGKRVFPAAEAGIRPGDVIKSINGVAIKDARHFSSLVNDSKGDAVSITYQRGDSTKTVNVKPCYDAESEEYKLGILVRDGTSGIGTLTFVDAENSRYGALGHSVNDASTGIIIPVQDGNITNATIRDIIKSKNGSPGELSGAFDLLNPTGSIDKNNEFGIYGDFYNTKALDSMRLIPIATADEIKIGKAEIYCTLDDNVADYYEINVIKINSQSKKDVKGMVIEVTDPRLIEKTGGIVQGMSGSPIIQDGKLIGAVTHVMINDTLRGYGMFIEWMVDEAKAS